MLNNVLVILWSMDVSWNPFLKGVGDFKLRARRKGLGKIFKKRQLKDEEGVWGPIIFISTICCFPTSWKGKFSSKTIGLSNFNQVAISIARLDIAVNH